MKLGAVDYLAKPFEVGDLLQKVERYLPRRYADSTTMIAEDLRTRELVELANRVAASDATVMIGGESGTGKEVLARYIHARSARADGPFVAINCAAIPDNMLEAVLFGYEKGAFTGAVRASAGKFEQAQGGTLLLDEISEMSLPLQAKLLRVLQEGEFERVGGIKTQQVDVRVVAATNRDLEEAVKAGEFRRDLYFRLKVVEILVPPLRKRPEDIELLARHFLERFVAETGRRIEGFTPAASEALRSYHWPGNIRELANAVERAYILTTGREIQPSAMPFEIIIADSQLYPKHELPTLDEVKRKIITQTLKFTKGRKMAAAKILGIERRSLNRLIEKLNISIAQIKKNNS